MKNSSTVSICFQVIAIIIIKIKDKKTSLVLNYKKSALGTLKFSCSKSSKLLSRFAAKDQNQPAVELNICERT